ncbi:pilus assembly PilX N-terminal domain-containing protein [Thalassomonas actiniarum]|uniref:Pilus assembly PilX N-terminal domain-containing protein n=1 Tax=Thalassomonas actiniarum TaxID=485447 RepID=A0AAE9YP80_9GAMM|nr:pilus assembly PilX N-terminal domain-containing protein [Thalassomonas actiniarum]WDD97963.1 pilus assembly PilX N-terminal domain-containing protein [Thalassomonas actiniarum]
MALKKQQGVVLIVSLVFLIALTAVAAALMQNTSVDIKMSGASQLKVVATQEAISSLDEVIFNQVTQTDGINDFAYPLGVFPLNPAVTADNTTAQISVANTNNLVVDCPHSQSASSAQVLKCNVLRIQVNRLYGRNNNSAVQINSGVAQEVLP